MIYRKECLAMLLAGGQGSRLFALTNKIAKPAVPFGGKYRIIDFTLSNCINSQIDTVGVLTQYQPLVLNEYIGNGHPWDMDRLYGGAFILQPYQAKESCDWYRGTANAIFQNLHFIDRYNPENVLILSGDHIYKMDYGKMLRFHNEQKADITIAVIDVSISEASRFGIMSVDKNNTIVQFEEKPKQPKSTLASMGIYIFKTQVMREYLKADDQNPKSGNDFGKDIIPKMLHDGAVMKAYPFSGYWKDVGTLDSLWDANMDLLGEKPKFDLADSKWKIHSRNQLQPPQAIGADARITNSLVAGGCEINGVVMNSVIGNGVTVEKDAVIKDSILFDGVKVESGAKIEYSIIDENVIVGKEAGIGQEKAKGKGITVVGRNVKIAAKTFVPAGSIVEKDM